MTISSCLEKNEKELETLKQTNKKIHSQDIGNKFGSENVSCLQEKWKKK